MERRDSEYLILLYLLWAFSLMGGAAVLEFIKDAFGGSNASFSLYIVPYLTMFILPGFVIPNLILLVRFEKFDSQETDTLRVSIPVAWIMGLMVGFAVAGAFWMRYDLPHELITYHVAAGAALLFLGAFYGRRNPEMLAMGIGLLATSPGYWNLPGDMAIPFFLICIWVAHLSAIFYHAGIYTRHTQRKAQMMTQLPLHRPSEHRDGYGQEHRSEYYQDEDLG